MEVRQVPAANGWKWIVEAFGLFKRNPVMWLVIIFIYLVIAVVASMVPLIGSLTFNLVAPVFVAGMMIGCQALERGDELLINHLFEGFKRNASQLVTVGGLYMVGMILIVAVAFGVALANGVSLKAMTDPQAASQASFGVKAAISVLIAFLVGLLLLIPLIMAYWFAPLLVVFHQLEPIAAMKLSFWALWQNMGAGFVCSVIAVGLIILGSIPFGLGLIVVIPILFLSLYTSYKDIFSLEPEVESELSA